MGWEEEKRREGKERKDPNVHIDINRTGATKRAPGVDTAGMPSRQQSLMGSAVCCT